MKVFVIAMDKEAQPVLNAINIERDITYCGKRLVTGKLSGESIGIVICGVGKVNAACGTQIAIDELGADAIINVGVAGGLNGGVKVGEIYAISDVVQYDFDLTQLNGTKIGTLDECSENYLPLALSDRCPAKKLATGDRFNDSKQDYRHLTEVLHADVRDMECGAIAQVCMHANVPCYSFKIISDLAGSGSTTDQYLKNLSLCFKTLERELKNIMEYCRG